MGSPREPLTALLPVDTNLHWCYSLHGGSSANGEDYSQYSIRQDGVPIITHLHGWTDTLVVEPGSRYDVVFDFRGLSGRRPGVEPVSVHASLKALGTMPSGGRPDGPTALTNLASTTTSQPI